MENINQNDNLYSPEQWNTIKSLFRRRRWGFPIAFVADEPDFVHYAHRSLWGRFLDRWVI